MGDDESTTLGGLIRVATKQPRRGHFVQVQAARIIAAADAHRHNRAGRQVFRVIHGVDAAVGRGPKGHVERSGPNRVELERRVVHRRVVIEDVLLHPRERIAVAGRRRRRVAIAGAPDGLPGIGYTVVVQVTVGRRSATFAGDDDVTTDLAAINGAGP